MSILEYPLKSDTEDPIVMSLVKHKSEGLVVSDAPDSCTSLSLDPLMEIKTEVKMEVEVCYESDGSVKPGSEDFMSVIGDEDGSLPFSKEVDVEKPFMCRECGKAFSMETCPEQHFWSHTRKRADACGECGKAFSQKSSLRELVETHKGERPYACNDYRKPRLGRRARNRTGWRSFARGDCVKSFSQKSHLETGPVTRTGERPFVCEDCGKSFSLLSSLKFHMVIHMRERPFVCSDCGKSFSQKLNLKTHMVIHMGEMAFAHQDCGKLSSHKSSVNDPMGSHTEEKPFACEECGKTFSWKNSLKRHFLTHTGSC